MKQISERKLTPEELKQRKHIIKNMLRDKRSLVLRYGKDAEKVLYGKATNTIKNKTKEPIQDNFKPKFKLTESANINNIRTKIKKFAPPIYKNYLKAETKSLEYDELTKFPELKEAIVSLLTSDFDKFLSSIDWVAPKPTTFRINLKNSQEFYLIYNNDHWVCQVESKKYNLISLPEEQRAVEAIARILRYGQKEEEQDEEEEGFTPDDEDIEIEPEEEPTEEL